MKQSRARQWCEATLERAQGERTAHLISFDCFDRKVWDCFDPGRPFSAHGVHHTWFSFVNTSTIRVKDHQRCHGLFSDAAATCHWLKNGMQEDKAYRKAGKKRQVTEVEDQLDCGVNLLCANMPHFNF